MRRPFIRQDQAKRDPYAFNTITCSAGLLVGINGEEDTCCIKYGQEYVDVPFNYVLFLTDIKAEESFSELELIESLQNIKYGNHYILIHEDKSYDVYVRQQGETFYETHFKESRDDYKRFLIFLDRAIKSKKLYMPVQYRKVSEELQLFEK